MILHYLGLDHIGHKAGPRRYDVHKAVHRNANGKKKPKYDPKTT